MREEIRSHAKTLGCRHVLGYSESCVVFDDVCILSATGTAAIIKEDRTYVGFYKEEWKREEDSSVAGERTKDEDLETLQTPNKHKSTGGNPGNPLRREESSTKQDGVSGNEGIKHKPRKSKKIFTMADDASGKPILPCAICHVAYRHDTAPFANMRLSPCGLCRGKFVPEVLLSTTGKLNNSESELFMEKYVVQNIPHSCRSLGRVHL